MHNKSIELIRPYFLKMFYLTVVKISKYLKERRQFYILYK